MQHVQERQQVIISTIKKYTLESFSEWKGRKGEGEERERDQWEKTAPK